MKLTLLLTTVAILQASAHSVAQNVSFSGTNVQLKTVFAAIKKQTGFVVFYDNELLKASKPVTLHLDQVSVEELLSASLRGQGMAFSISDKTIAIRKQPVFMLPVLGSVAPTVINISGKVTDNEGLALPGVTVVIKNTQKATVTNDSGIYRLPGVPNDAVLVFSYIGFEKQEIPVSGQTRVDITMAKAANAGLDEIVVVGYGTQKKSDLTGAVANVSGDMIAQRKTTQISQALQGSMPGVMVTRNSNAPGATASVRVRGITTMSNEAAPPLIILDGVPVDDINSVNPNDVESISVLKDAASASIYGARAASGVVVITTKRAKSGQMSLDYTVEYGVEKPTKMPQYVDPQRYMQLVNELRWNDNGNNANEYPTYTKDLVDNYYTLNKQNPDQYPVTDFRDLIMKNSAPRQTHLLTLSGSGKTLRSRVSLGYDKTDGLYDPRGYERVTARVNNDLFFNKYVSATVDFNFRRTMVTRPTITTGEGYGDEPFYKMGIMPGIYAAEWSDGRVGSGKDGANVFGQIKYGGFKKEWYNQAGAKVAIDVTPVEGLKLSAVLSPFLNFDKIKRFQTKAPYTARNNPGTTAGYLEGLAETKLEEVRNDNYRYTMQFLANYNKKFGKHDLGLLAGYEYFRAFNEELGASRGQYILGSYPYLNLGPLEFRDNSGKAFENAYRSVFGRVAYSFADKYLIQGNLRYDASSRFAPGYRWGAFPSVSAGWVLSEENFMKSSSKWLSFLKVRASWGSLGNERIKGNYPYQAILSFENSSLFYQGNTVVTAQSAAQWQYAIRDISWETTESYNFGADVNFLNNRLRLSGDYFQKTTRDILLELEIPDYIGFDNPFQNTGRMYTTGWEMTANWNDRLGDFSYSVSANLSDFRSKMGDLGGTEFIGDKIKIKGSEFDEWYGYISEGIFQTAADVAKSPVTSANVKAGDVKYRDISGPNGVPDGKISPEYDRVLLGGSLPRYMYGGSINLSYKNLDLGVFVQGVGKQNVRLSPDMVQPLRENFGNFPTIIDGPSWSMYKTEAQNLAAKYPRFTNTSAGNNYAMSDFWMFNGRYFRLKNISLGYNLPRTWTNKVHIQNLRVYGTVTDPVSLNKYPRGWDPEMGMLTYPITTGYVIGASVKF
ncbi:TonB-dependent receptor [Chitinophaga sedimenti]|uniref:TonB-dependent receptor n=1 Tax=Chitinophaga sedimenti TaxID=2033606 RepID=UPI002004220A|nr:TonB-dependent receptor [Chitinophaga sedimenti]MCK7556760.1 TonB-dependent receptor [Chitinophaga sedimenti]